ncbi:MAG: glycosyltransferase [Faecalibacterium prausnitzii]
MSEKSRVLFVNDGSKDKTWELIQSFAAQDEHYIGISQSRNRGHQNAVLAGLMEALHSGTCDVTISIDCDGQDDINAMDEMVKNVSGRCRGGLRRAQPPRYRHLLQALHRRGLLPCDERSGRETSCSTTQTTASSAPVCWKALPTTGK